MLAPLEVLRRYAPHRGTFASALAARAAADDGREFIWFDGRGVTYADAVVEVARTAAMLRALGVGRGERVAVMSTNHPTTVFVLFALARLGAAMVAVNPDHGADEVRYVLAHAGVAGVVCSPQALATVRSACAAPGLSPWFVLNAPPDDPRAPGAPPCIDALLPPAAPPGGGDADDNDSTADDPDAPCVFIYTSGTTGSPKGVMHSQRNVVTAGEGFVERMHLQPEDRLLCILPMFHVNAICYSLGGALAAGATLALEPRFSASRFWPAVHASGATEVNTIAAATGILMRRPRSEYLPGHRLTKMYGGPFDESTHRMFRDEFGVPDLIEGYGMSEVPGVLNNPFDGPRKVGSMGRPSRHPDPSVELSRMRVVDDDGRPVADGVVGELEVRTPIAMLGYHRDPEQTAAAWRDGWFVTGDLGRRDADGYFWFVARKKDIIRRRGENIAGAQIDGVVNAHPDVVVSAAVPVPAELGEDEILVAVVRRAGSALTADDLAAWCRERLAAFKVPRYVAFVDALPMTPTQRVAKHRLRGDAALRAAAVDLERG